MDRTRLRIADILDAIDKIGRLLAAHDQDSLAANPFASAAYERFLEIVSEATRHLPDELKAKAPQIEWRRIADIGNHLRHAYHRTDIQVLWLVHSQGKLDELRAVLSQFAGEPTKD